MMKIKINKATWAILVTMFGATLGYGQSNSFPPSGNAGVGTGTTPDAPFHILRGNTTTIYPSSTGMGNIMQKYQFGNNALEIGISGATNARRMWILARHNDYSSYGSTYGTLHLQPDVGNKTNFRGVGIGFTAGTALPIGTHLAVNGKVGVGTMSPTYMFEVAGNAKWTGNASSFTEVNSNTNGLYLRQYSNNGTKQSWLIRGYAGADGVQAYFDDGGINVNGIVKAREINITATGWPDYVFMPEYKMMSLDELESFIKENGHLPNVPSEAEVMGNGINLAEMNVKLLEKVEELTLYIIQLKSDLDKFADLQERLKKVEYSVLY